MFILYHHELITLLDLLPFAMILLNLNSFLLELTYIFLITFFKNFNDLNIPSQNPIIFVANFINIFVQLIYVLLTSFLSFLNISVQLIYVPLTLFLNFLNTFFQHSPNYLTLTLNQVSTILFPFPK